MLLLLQLHLTLFLTLWLIGYSNEQFHLYYSSSGSEKLEYDYDCLDFYANDRISDHAGEQKQYRQDHQIIPFCRRDNLDDGFIVPETNIPVFTFKQLKEQNISSFDLYTWSAPIDLIEYYQAYREGQIDNKTNVSLSKFYNCSVVNRFGSFCQYYFHSSTSPRQQFDDIVMDLLTTRDTRRFVGVCYIHINCTRNNFSWCLDWREICDERVDCWPEPVDEQQCYELKRNECNENEYRCRNGQCIPEEYVMDNPIDPDCMDTTDERLTSVHIAYQAPCSKGDPSIRCLDTSCRHSDSVDCSSKKCVNKDACNLGQVQGFDDFLVARTNNYHLSDECWSTMICFTKSLSPSSLNKSTHAHLFNGSCNNICHNHTSCTERMQKYCPSLFEFPAQPIAWNDVYLFYSSNRTNTSSISPDFVCFNEQTCNFWSSNIWIWKISNPTTLLSCQISTAVKHFNNHINWITMLQSFRHFFRQICATTMTDIETNCSDTTLFQCGKKCLSKHRLMDYTLDCPDDSDEKYNESCALNDKYRMNCTYQIYGIYVNSCMNRVLAKARTGNTTCLNNQKLPHFPTLCDQYLEYKESVNGEIETDETNCEEWLCDNQYTRCDGIWNCLNGADEINCRRPLCNNKNAHPCLLLNSSQPICLPISRAGDGIIDCIGATDERHLCRNSTAPDITGFQSNMFRCRNNHTHGEQMTNKLTTVKPERTLCIFIGFLCDEVNHCPLNDDEESDFCKGAFKTSFDCRFLGSYKRPASFIECELADVYKVLVLNDPDHYGSHFCLANYSLYPPELKHVPLVSKVLLNKNLDKDSNTTIYSQNQVTPVPFSCHGGILVNILPNRLKQLSNQDQKRCLCPPAFYGSQCQYQSQRVTVTLQISTLEGQIPFTLVVYLLNDKHHIIQSFHQINYLSIRDCQVKFGFHLLYSSRPKLSDGNYSVRIDAFETKTLSYRASWTFPVLYSFLVVYRLSILLTIPLQIPPLEDSCPLKCSAAHGECAIYVNTKQFFCRCMLGWFRPLCTNSYKCDCSPDSICTGLWNNRSICVCPLQKFGPRCYLRNNACEQERMKQCRRNGECISSDVRITSDPKTTCICSIKFYGTNCQYNQSRIDISFTSLSTRNIPDYILLHFITVHTHPSSTGRFDPAEEWGPHKRLSTFKKIPVDRVSITVYWSQPFHLLFADTQRDMYLLMLQTKFKASVKYNVTLESTQRCLPIRELLNSTILSFPLLRRVKYYHLPCQRHPELSCFHNEDQFICLCTYDRRANCFTFDHHLKYNCSQMSYCENDGQCFQNNITCPTAAVCACPPCYFGTRCHLSTKGFGLPLDVILGYKIWPNTSFTKQPLTLRMSVFVTVLMLITGLINAVLCIPTFREKKVRELGCGLYLYTTSLISLLTIITFTLKFILLILTQLSIITSRTVLIGQCASIDFLLKAFLQIGDWLYVCVTVERLFSVIKGINFNKKSSRKMAKWVIGFVVIFVIGTSIHEAYYRRVIDDVEDQRSWCIVRYPKSYSNILTTYTTVMTIIHFMGPFIINIISAIGIIFIAAQYRLKAEKRRSYHTHLRIQIRQHKHLIISPIILIVLALPRIILAFTLQCMKSARDSVTLFLIGYFISFIPPVLTFAVFILPSDTYTKAFKKSMRILIKQLCCKK